MGKKIVTYEINNPLPDWVTPRVLKAMYEDGKSLRQLADEFHVSHETIRQLIKKVASDQ